MSDLPDLAEVIRHCDTAYLDEHFAWDASPADIAEQLRTTVLADAEPLIVSRFDTAIEPALEEEAVLTVGCIAEDGRPVALLLDAEDRRKVGGWLTPTSTVFRASHDSIVMGHYATRHAAQKHCETVLRREVGDEVFLGWVPDHGGEDAPEELCIGEDIECSGYVVTPVEVASAYDEEADE